MSRQHWKNVEAEIAAEFCGLRVPLSGSNSGHRTSADIRPDPKFKSLFPSDLYVEAKRARAFSHLIEQHLTTLQKGQQVQFATGSSSFVLFELRGFKRRGRALPGPILPLPNRSALVTLYAKTIMKAVGEEISRAVVVCRIHDRHGIFCFTSLAGYRYVRDWWHHVNSFHSKKLSLFYDGRAKYLSRCIRRLSVSKPVT